ncbi:hypothetical protein Spith_1199 [Spirochaeta thermophila DSM 6578]|uniref:Uncharacterized protein n=1 Tax=Winmispira thermophila (strain ATCC 700085 / DSM 6578 / Z-1203) TaxID=869211 RepID=G0GER3_WINT7|nr:hypothetical protein [Spirochaeta thermophila]AEJ61469.1 hypothetical protein Spith_1199 [Spirochaeta thermophila DSM 6578]
MKRLHTIVPALFLACLALPAQDVSGLEFSIRLYNQRIYYPDSPIQIKITLTNAGARDISFKIADQRIHSFGFDMRTISNTRVPESEFFITHRIQNQPVFYRTITLLPGEEYAIVEDLKDYCAVTEPGVYVIQGLFYPDLYAASSTPIRSNRLILTVHPPMDTLEEAGVRVETQTGEVLKAQPLPPDEVVRTVIEARQKGQWERFFLFIDLEALYTRDRTRRQRYLNAAEEDRIRLLEEFKKGLTQQVVDQDIVLIPQEFEIVKTEYTSREGSVRVIEKFRYPTYTEVKEYTYSLQKRDGIWYIVDYTVQNLRTE